MPAVSLLSTFFLALFAAANPATIQKNPLTLTFVKHFNNHSSKKFNSPAENRLVDYIASVGIGNPATQCK